MFELQKYLLAHSLQELEDEYGVTAKIEGYKASFNYSQIDSPKAAKVVVQSRGTILATLDKSPFPEDRPVGFTLVLARPFDRFFNYGEVNSDAEVDWASSVFYEKLDGTLIIVYFDAHKGSWCVATRKQPEASVPLPDLPQHTFASLFREIVGEESIDDWFSRIPVEYTLCFELCSRHNRVVVDYPESFVSLLAVRSNLTGEELCYSSVENFANTLGVSMPEKHTLTKEVLFKFVNDQSPTEHEGIVVVDAKFDRLKVKSISHTAYSKIKGSLSDRAQRGNRRGILEVILAGTDDDVMPLLQDEEKLVMTDLKGVLSDLNTKYVKAFNSVEEKDTDKEYALSLQKVAEEYPLWVAPLFAMWRKGYKSFFEFIEANQKNGKWPNSFLDKILKDQ